MTDFTALSLAAITRSYNVVAAALGETEVRKFSDKANAHKRLTAIAGRANDAGLVLLDAEGCVLAKGEIFSVGRPTPAVEYAINDGTNSAGEPASGDPVLEEVAAGREVLDAPEETADKGTDAPVEATAAPAAKLATTLDLTGKIKVLVANPKRAKSRAHAVFSLYADGQTGQQFVDAVLAAGYTTRVALANLHWDLDHGFIYLGE